MFGILQGGFVLHHICLACLVSAAVVQTSPDIVQIAETNQLILPKGTPVVVELSSDVSSERAHDGDHFPIKVVEPVVFNGAVVIPIGATGEGEVVHAANSNGQGMPGELIVAARFVSCGPTRFGLGHLQFSSAGRDRTMAWIVERSIFRYPSMVKGNLAELPVGTRGIAKVAADTPFTNPSACLPTQAPTPAKDKDNE